MLLGAPGHTTSNKKHAKKRYAKKHHNSLRSEAVASRLEAIPSRLEAIDGHCY